MKKITKYWFCSTKRTCDEITTYLRSDGWPALAIHGDKEQNERDWVLDEFRKGKTLLWLQTDVAARGIGMYNFNFDLLNNHWWFFIYFYFELTNCVDIRRL